MADGVARPSAPNRIPPRVSDAFDTFPDDEPTGEEWPEELFPEKLPKLVGRFGSPFEEA